MREGSSRCWSPRGLGQPCCWRSWTRSAGPVGMKLLPVQCGGTGPAGAKITALGPGSLARSSKSSSLWSSPLRPGQCGLGFSPAVSAPREDFRRGPWFLLLPAPMAIWQAGAAGAWLQGKDAKGGGPAWGRVPAVLLALTLGKSPNR